MSAAHPPRPRKAVVPLAGLGTRHFPASHAVKKELFPVVGPDGISRALFHYHLIELVAAGFEEICLIVQPGGDSSIRSYLEGPDEDYLRRLEKYPALREEARRMAELAERVSFAFQHTQEGYGHAVHQSRGFTNGQPFLLCLGDHLFRGSPHSPNSPYLLLTEAAEISAGKSVSAVNRIGPDDLKGYGTIAGFRRKESPSLIDVSLIIEKPGIDLARQQLRVEGLGSEEFLGWYGMHLLSPSIHDILEEMIRDNIRDGGEFQLTRAQEIQRQREGYLALEMTGAERFDFGLPDDYLAGLAAFRKT